MLPSADLKPVYDSAVWLWLNRDFSNSPADRAVERVFLRFGVTSYPQCFLVHPSTLATLADCGQSLQGFLAAFRAAAAQVKKPGPEVAELRKKLADAGTKRPALEALAKGKDAYEFWLEARERLRALPDAPKRTIEERLADPDPDQRALALEELAATKEAAAPAKSADLLADPDGLVRLRALEFLAKSDRPSIVKRATALLKTPGDPFRYAVLDVLKAGADTSASASIVAAFNGAGEAEFPSLNPNVLRIHCASALSTCGDAAAMEALKAPAQSGEFLNGLTSECVNAVAAIGLRTGKAAAARILVEGFPEIPEGKPENIQAYCRSLAEKIHKALTSLAGSEAAPFPREWNARTRDDLRAAWRTRVAGLK